MHSPLVSVVTPCYNGESYLDRYFAGVLAQTYGNIELVFVDDGSTDGTLRIAESYRSALESRGVAFKVLSRENGGLAAAVNTGLAEVSGEFITWPDADDVMAPACIEAKVLQLRDHPEAGLAFCQVRVADERDLSRALRVWEVPHALRVDVFDAFIRERGMMTTGVAHMARAGMLFDALSGRRIYDSRAGQNWQMLLPLAYLHGCRFVDAPLATYVVRRDSHSRSYITYGDQLRRTYEHEDILRHVLPTISMAEEDRAEYDHYLDVKYLRRRLGLAAALGDVELVGRTLAAMDAEWGRSTMAHTMAALCMLGLGGVAYRGAEAAKKAKGNARDIAGKTCDAVVRVVRRKHHDTDS